MTNVQEKFCFFHCAENMCPYFSIVGIVYLNLAFPEGYWHFKEEHWINRVDLFSDASAFLVNSARHAFPIVYDCFYRPDLIVSEA